MQTAGPDLIEGLSHIGIAVRSMEEALYFFQSILGLQAHSSLERPDIRVCMLKVGEVSIELMQPLDDEGVVARFIKKRGEGIHHVSFEVDDIEKGLETLSLAGVELIDKIPRQGVEGRIAFLNPHGTHGVLIELTQKSEAVQ